MLAIRVASDGFIPVPENKVDITASGTVISYQGYMSSRLGNNIGVNGDLLDPLDNKNYSYATNVSLTKFQVLGFLEGDIVSNGFISGVYANNYLDRAIKTNGNNVGIILETSTNNPIQDTGTGVDVVHTNSEYTAYFDSALSLTGTGRVLQFLQLPLLYKSSDEINLIGNQSLGAVNGTFEDGSLNGFYVYSGGVGGSPVLLQTTSTGSYNNGLSLYIKTSDTTNGGTAAGGGWIGINNGLYFEGVEYIIKYKAKKLNNITNRVYFSVQNGNGVQNCLTHNSVIIDNWQDYKHSCILDMVKGGIYIYTYSHLNEFMIDNIKLIPAFLENYTWGVD